MSYRRVPVCPQLVTPLAPLDSGSHDLRVPQQIGSRVRRRHLVPHPRVQRWLTRVPLPRRAVHRRGHAQAHPNAATRRLLRGGLLRTAQVPGQAARG